MSALREVSDGRWGLPLRIAERGASRVVVEMATRYIARPLRGVRPTDADGRLTAMVKTFERPEIAQRFVRHLRRVFSGPVFVVDDSRVPMTWSVPGVEVVGLAFDSGVSAGRAAGLGRVGTEFVLVADDDHVFTATADLGAVVEYLDRQPDVDAVAFTVVEIPRWYTLDFPNDQTSLFPGHAPVSFAPDAMFGGLPARYKTAQCYVARTAALREIGWDPQLRMLDHSDFFSRAAGRMTFVQDEQMIVLHARTPWKKVYTERRGDTASDGARLAEKWGAAAHDA